MVISNAFSFQMLNLKKPGALRYRPMPLEEVQGMKEELVSAIGHDDTARLLSQMIGVELQMARTRQHLEPQDSIIVAQVIGGRLPIGATELPPGTEMVFLEITVTE